MKLPDDDEIYDVDQTYLGPPGRYVGRLRYRALAIGPLLIMLGLAFLVRTGIGFSLLSVALTVLVSIRLAQWIVDNTSQERPVSVLAVTMSHELTARRVPTRRVASRRTRAFRRRATRIQAPDAPSRRAVPRDARPAATVPGGALDGTVPRRRWRHYAHAAAASRKGSPA
ncbi:hypothetical protein [Isoptericola sp. BMS4]|uniref:hypothetical protein n=1 Tax=Isoptericola sp. BMS4 TaxID=2527875 RepID=UPI001422A83E|nr:hypothetical protein [Isoptericola sp. BMS4]